MFLDLNENDEKQKFLYHFIQKKVMEKTDKATEKIYVKMKDVLDLLAGKISDAEFAGKVEVSA